MQKKIIQYEIWKPFYSREHTERISGLIVNIWQNYETAKTMRSALRIARRVGPGAVIERHSKRKNGTIKIDEFELTSAR
jgi:hypothetical protein